MHATSTQSRAEQFFRLAVELRLLDRDDEERCLVAVRRSGGDPGQVALARGLLDEASVARIERVAAARARRGRAVDSASSEPLIILGVLVGVALLFALGFLFSLPWGHIC